MHDHHKYERNDLKNVKFHDFHEVEEVYKLNQFRITKDGQFIYSVRRDLGVRVVLDRKQDHSHLKTNNIVGDLVVLDTIAFLTNTRDQEVQIDKEVLYKDSEIYADIYPGRCIEKHYVFNTEWVGENIKERKVCIEEKDVFLSVTDSEYKLEQIAKPVADYFLNLNTDQNEMYVALPKITKIDADHITIDNKLNYENNIPYLQKVWVKDGKCFETYIEDFDTVFLRKRYIPSWFCNKFCEKEVLISDKVIRDETITEDREVPKMCLYDFAIYNGYTPDFDICCMHGRHYGGSDEVEVKEKYGEDYEKYLADKSNWHIKTFLIEKKVWTEKIEEIIYRELQVLFRRRIVSYNGWSQESEFIEKEFDIDKANEALSRIYDPLMAPKELLQA